MKLEEYTNLKKDSFCYWVETKTKKLGNINGSTSYKFGIYEYNQPPRNDGGYSFDNPVRQLVCHTIEYLRASSIFKNVLSCSEDFICNYTGIFIIF